MSQEDRGGMGKHLVFVGGGHAHLTALLNLRDYTKLNHKVSLISPSPYHYYSGMGPGMLSGIYRPEEIRFHIKKLAEDRGAGFIEDKVVRIDPVNRNLFLHSGRKISYDVVSFNTGSEIPVESLLTTPEENVFPVKPITNLLQARRFILERLRKNALNMVVIGGGPGGVEISSNLWRLVKENGGDARIILIGGKRLLFESPDKARRLALSSLQKRDIEVIEGNYAKAIESRTIILSDGRSIAFDVALMAVGIRPSPLFRDSGLPTGGDGGLLVNPYLQSVVYPEIFGGGDCISLEGHPLAKVGVYAVKQNPTLYHNLMAALQGDEMKVFKPQGAFLLILNMGDGRGILWKKGWVWDGRLAFVLKDYIDRRFMRKFQVSREREEEIWLKKDERLPCPRDP